MNKITITLGAILLAGTISASAMSMSASDTMMDHNMKATGSMMMHDDMKATGTMMMDHKMMKDDMKKDMMKCLDEKKATKMEVKKFQKDNGIITTGFIGKMTKAKLMKMGCMKDMMSDAMHATGTMMTH